MIRKTTILILLCLLLSTSSAAGQQTLDAIVAVVEGNIILHSEVLLSARQEAQRRQIDPSKNPEKLIELYDEILDALIDRQALIVLAAEDSVEVNDDEITPQLEGRLQQMREAYGNDTQLELAFSMPMRKIRDLLYKNIKDQVLVGKYKSFKEQEVQVSRSEVEEFFHTYKDSTHILPPIVHTYNLSHLLKIVKPVGKTAREKKAVLESIHQRIIAGETFELLSDEYRDDKTTGISSSDIGWIDRGVLNPVIETTISNLDSGEVSEVVMTELDPNKMFGFHILQNMGTTEQKIHPNHIFFTHSLNSEDEQVFRDSLLIIRDKIIKGETFEENAENFSDDVNSSGEGGMIGTYPINHQFFEQFPDFKTEALKLKEGEISQPFKTIYGFHIIKVNSLVEPRERSLEVDYEAIMNSAKVKKADEYFFEWLAEARKNLYIEKKPNPLQKDIKK